MIDYFCFLIFALNTPMLHARVLKFKSYRGYYDYMHLPISSLNNMILQSVLIVCLFYLRRWRPRPNADVVTWLVMARVDRRPVNTLFDRFRPWRLPDRPTRRYKMYQYRSTRCPALQQARAHLHTSLLHRQVILSSQILDSRRVVNSTPQANT